MTLPWIPNRSTRRSGVALLRNPIPSQILRGCCLHLRCSAPCLVPFLPIVISIHYLVNCFASWLSTSLLPPCHQPPPYLPLPLVSMLRSLLYSPSIHSLVPYRPILGCSSISLLPAVILYLSFLIVLLECQVYSTVIGWGWCWGYLDAVLVRIWVAIWSPHAWKVSLGTEESTKTATRAIRLGSDGVMRRMKLSSVQFSSVQFSSLVY